MQKRSLSFLAISSSCVGCCIFVTSFLTDVQSVWHVDFFQDGRYSRFREKSCFCLGFGKQEKIMDVFDGGHYKLLAGIEYEILAFPQDVARSVDFLLHLRRDEIVVVAEEYVIFRFRKLIIMLLVVQLQIEIPFEPDAADKDVFGQKVFFICVFVENSVDFLAEVFVAVNLFSFAISEPFLFSEHGALLSGWSVKIRRFVCIQGPR